MVRGGALVDIQLESNEPAFLPLRAIPVKAMPVVRGLIESGAMHAFRVDQVDRGQGTATLSIEGLVQDTDDAKAATQTDDTPVPPLQVREPVKSKPTAGELAKIRQQEMLRRMREGENGG
jgi:hypothetical protein